MPIPHQVTKEFFIPSDDLSLLENEIATNPESARQRLNDLLFLFSLIDSAFDRDNGEDNISRPQEDDFINEPLEPDNFDSIADNLSENDDNDQSEENSENSENTSPSNKITEPDEELSEDNFDDVVDLFDDPSSSEQLPENIEHTDNHSNLNEFELNNLFNVLQRLRNQQRINEQNQMNEYDDW